MWSLQINNAILNSGVVVVTELSLLDIRKSHVINLAIPLIYRLIIV